MANELEKMIVRLEAQNEQYLEKIDQSNRAFKKFREDTEDHAKAIGETLKVAAEAFIGFEAIKKFAENLFEATSRMQTFEARLVGVTGSVEAASETFKKLQEFTKSTPFTVDAVTNAFIDLKNRGLDASKESMTGLGNIASQFGKSLEDVTGIVEHAAAGSTKAFRELGIQATKDGENLKLTFNGVTETIGNNAGSIEKYLVHLGNTKYADAMDREANTVKGALVKLNEATEDLFEQDAKAVDPFKNAIKDLTKSLEDPRTKQAMSEIASVAVRVFASIVELVTETVKAVDSLINGFVELSEKFAHFLGLTTTRDGLEKQLAASNEWLKKNGDLLDSQDETLVRVYKNQLAQNEALKEKIKLQEESKKNEAGGTSGGVEAFADNAKFNTAASEAQLEKQAEKLKKLEDEREKNLESVYKSLEDETQAIERAYREREELITKSTEAGSRQQEDLRQLSRERFEKQMSDHNKKLEAEQKRHWSFMQQLDHAGWAGKVSLISGAMAQITQGVAQHSRALFQVNKAAALAQAAVDLPASVISAVKNGGGLPWGAAFGALTLAAGLAQISAINGTSFEGGGSGTTPSFAGSAPSINGQAQPQGGTIADPLSAQKSTQQINITFDSAITDTAALRDFIAGPFSEALGDGVRINAVLK